MVLRADIPGIEPDEASTENGVLDVAIPLPKAEERQKVEIKPKPA